MNFFPQYTELLNSRRKFATTRLGDARGRIHAGQRVQITVGWDKEGARQLAQGIVREVLVKKVKDLTNRDLEGESPDCVDRDAVAYVLSSIYRTVVAEDDFVSIIKWKYD